MRVLVVNDDGIFAEGLTHLLDFAKKLGEVTVVAPKVQQSGKSQGIELHKPYEIKKAEMEGVKAAYAVDSTPADCVRFAILGLKEQYDLVLSGINRGYNIGADIAYSGTVGAVYEAARQKVKTLAFSTDFTGFDMAAAKIGEVYSFIEEHKLLEASDILNINIPAKEYKGIRITHQGPPMYEDEFFLVGNDLYEPRLRSTYVPTAALDTDTGAIMNGYASITPLRRDNTDDKAYAALCHLQK